MREDSSSADARQSGRRAPLARAVLRVVLKLAYPVVILAAWQIGSPRWIGLALFVLFWAERRLGTTSFAALLARLTALECGVAGTLSVASIMITLTGSEMLLRAYPVLVNIGMLIAFGVTLTNGGPSMIERFARLRQPDLGERAVRYTRQVTRVWCGFFVLNGAAAAGLAVFGSRDEWALYNGAIAYVLIAALIVGEIAWRHLVARPNDALARRGAT